MSNSLVEGTPRFGIVLPHFGRDVDPRRVLRVAVRAEELDFSSVWVRDRLGASAPHGLELEAGGTTLLEPLVTLAAVAGVTERITLGTAVLTPVRHPLKLLQDVGSLCTIAGGNRIILGMGLGVSASDLESVGHSFDDRVGLFEETMEVLRRGSSSSRVAHRGRYFRFPETEIDPSAPSGLELWYGGTSRAAVRRAVRFADGWLAGRLPLATFVQRIDYLRQLEDGEGRSLEIATQPLTVVHPDPDRARRRAARAVPLLAESSEGATDWIRPESGRFETVEDLAGMLIVGSIEECRREVDRLLGVGIGHVIFDLRLAFDWVEEAIDLIGHHIVPTFKANP